jgi:hypothetical protein
VIVVLLLCLLSPFAAVSGRNHKETCAGCIVSLTTPTRSSLNASRSVSFLSLAEKASRVFAASYLLRQETLSMKPCMRRLSGPKRAANGQGRGYHLQGALPSGEGT